MKNSIPKFAFLIYLTAVLSIINGCKILSNKYINDGSKINSTLEKTRPGDTVFLDDGIYKDIQMVFNTHGLQDEPIVLCAKNKGKVIFEGASDLRIGGKFLVVEGLVFTKGHSANQSVIEFRTDAQHVASNCRVTQCVIDGFNQNDRAKQDVWVALYGKYNRFDHNIVQNKLSAGVALAVLRDDTASTNNYHRIDHNFFGTRPRLGSNGGETIRVGTSKNSLLPSHTIIEDNYFYHCDGEVEIVSIKSCDNIIRRNTFFESEGSVVLRHGNNNVVESNIFIGNGKPHTGGVRVINSGHKIYNNFFYGLKGERFRSAFAIMNGVPNSLINRYHQVNNVLVGFNTFVDCDNIGFCVGKDNERTAVPINTRFIANLILNGQSETKIEFFDDTKGISFSNNYVSSQSGEININGFNPIDLNLMAIHGILIPTNSLPMVDAAYFSFISNDTSGNSKNSKFTVGATFNENQLTLEATTAEKITGINWYNSTIINETKNSTAQMLLVKNPSTELSEALAKIDDNGIIELTDSGTFIIKKPIEITKNVTIRAANNLSKKPFLKYSGENTGFTFFTLKNGGKLTLDGIAIDGESIGENNPEYAVLAKAPMIEHYSVSFNNCEFSNFTEANFSVLKGEKNTYADTILIQNSIFREMSCDAISLASEKDDNGRYNTENLIVRNCLFHKIMGNAINLYRGGNDESTFGPSLIIDHCVFNEVNNREAGSVLRLIGVQHASVTNTLFIESGKGGYIAKFDEMPWDNCKLEFCNSYNSGKIGSNNNLIAGEGNQHINPELNNTNQLDFILSPKVQSTMKTNDGKEMGCIWKNKKVLTNF